MFRSCQECNKPSLKLSIFKVNKRLRCTNDKCIAQYEITPIYKFLSHLLSSFLVFMSFYLSLIYLNWLIFVFFGIILPVCIHFLVLKTGKLKLVGLKAELKKKLNQ